MNSERDSRTIFCPKCGKVREDVSLESGEETPPCENCGETKLKVKITLVDSAGFHDHLALSGGNDGKSEFFRESERKDGRSSSADTEVDGTISHSAEGTSPQGEEYTLKICNTLIQKLNSIGYNFSEPIPGTGVVDCKCAGRNNQKDIIKIQVVRAIVDSEFWKELHNKGFIDRSNIPIDDLVKEIIKAIDHKVKKIPHRVRIDLILALDANMAPQLVLDKVVEDLRSEHLEWIRSLNFKQVWIVGPTTILTHRLDN